MTLSGLNIDGSNTFAGSPQDSSCPSPSSQGLFIKGANDVLENNNIYQSVPALRGNAIGVGWDGQPDNTIIRYNRIHDVGACLAFDHLIYLSHGNNVQIYDNWMWNDPHGWGVQIYPGPKNASIHDNVIDAAGSGFVIADDSVGLTSGNVVFNNVVMNSTGIQGGAEGSSGGVLVNSPGVAGTGNRVVQNDSVNNPGGISNMVSSVSSANVSVSGNLSSDPQFVDLAHHNYQLSSTSPLASWNLWNGANSPQPAPSARQGSRVVTRASSRVNTPRRHRAKHHRHHRAKHHRRVRRHHHRASRHHHPRHAKRHRSRR